LAAKPKPDPYPLEIDMCKLQEQAMERAGETGEGLSAPKVEMMKADPLALTALAVSGALSDEQAGAILSSAFTPDQGGDIPLCEQGNFYTIAKARGFTDFGMTVSGNFSNDALQKLSEQYDASLDGQAYQGGAAVRGEAVAEYLPPLPETTYNGYSDGSEPLFTCQMVWKYAREYAKTNPVAPLADSDPAMMHPAWSRVILYTDSIRGKQTCRDDLWAITGDELRALLAARLSARAADAPSEPTLDDLITAHRIALTPEYEGGFHAKVYGDSEDPVANGYGNTPRAAVLAALGNSRAADALDSQPTDEPCAECGLSCKPDNCCYNQNAPAATQPTVAAQQGSIGDDAQFRQLLRKWRETAPFVDGAKAWKDVVAYIDSRASSAPAAPIAQDADLAQARRSIAYIRRHVDESKNSHLWVLIDDDIETVSKYLAAPQQEGSEAGNG
jgi:hypothetical protein